MTMTAFSSCAPSSVETQGLPDELAAWVVAARAALEVTHRAGEWDAPARRRALAAMEMVANLVTVGKARLVMAEAEAGTWGRHGDRDMAGFLGRESHQGRSAGSAAVGQAATLSAMPTVAEALVDGPVTVTHVDQITRAAASSSAFAAALATPEGQERLVEMARRFDGAEFGKQLKALGAAVDPARRQRDHERQRADRYLEISHGPNGTHLKGFLDAVSGYRVVKAIEALDPRPAADDDRDRRTRWADALVTMADNVLRDPATTPKAIVPPQVIVTVSEDTWTALRRARDDAGNGGASLADGRVNRNLAKGSTVDVVAALRGRAAVVDEDGNAWPASEVGRLLCECALTRVVLGAGSQVLDLGYEDRYFDRRHWKALLASGWRTCAYPGCSMPLRWCQLHHLTWWSRDGRTDWDNLAPYCCFHHGLVHDRDLRVRRLADGSYEHRRADGALVGVSRPGGVMAPVGGAPRDGPPGEVVASAGGDLPDAVAAPGSCGPPGVPGTSGRGDPSGGVVPIALGETSGGSAPGAAVGDRLEPWSA